MTTRPSEPSQHFTVILHEGVEADKVAEAFCSLEGVKAAVPGQGPDDSGGAVEVFTVRPDIFEMNASSVVLSTVGVHTGPYGG